MSFYYEKSVYNVLHITHTKKTNINLNSVCFFYSVKIKLLFKNLIAIAINIIVIAININIIVIVINHVVVNIIVTNIIVIDIIISNIINTIIVGICSNIV